MMDVPISVFLHSRDIPRERPLAPSRESVWRTPALLRCRRRCVGRVSACRSLQGSRTYPPDLAGSKRRPSDTFPFMHRFALAAVFGAVSSSLSLAQTTPTVFTHADTLRGSNGPARAWWDVSFYDLRVAVSPADSTIRGS